MASNKKDDSYQPKQVIWREKDYEVHIGQVLGVLDFDTNFDNAFQKWKLTMQFIEDVKEAIRQEIIPLKEKNKLHELEPDAEAIRKMEKIWHGTTWLRVVMDSNSSRILARELFYEEPDETYEHKDEKGKLLGTYPCEVIRMPKLKNMIPIGEISSEYWGIQIRETMPLKYAWQGANFATVVKDGKFIHNLSDGLVPKIEASDMNSVIKVTYILNRAVYNGIMDILPMFFNRNYFIFAGNMQKILKWMKEENRSMYTDFISTATQETKNENSSRL